jgi:mono/diheme cytochrome c family protein
MNSERSESFSISPTASEPGVGRSAIPIWLIILFFVLLFWAMVYFDFHGAWFDQRVYTPYASIKQVDDMWPKSGDEGVLARGRKMFSDYCAVCHMETGVGNPANGCPPLVGSEWVMTPGPGRIVRIVSLGPTGPIEVNGKVYNGTMTPIGSSLSGDARQKAESIAALVSYVRKTFGKVPTLVKPEQVLAIQAQINGRTAPFTAQELKAVDEKD